MKRRVIDLIHEAEVVVEKAASLSIESSAPTSVSEILSRSMRLAAPWGRGIIAEGRDPREAQGVYVWNEARVRALVGEATVLAASSLGFSYAEEQDDRVIPTIDFPTPASRSSLFRSAVRFVAVAAALSVARETGWEG